MTGIEQARDIRRTQYLASEKNVKAFAHGILEQCQNKGFTDCEVDALLIDLRMELEDLRQARSYVTAFRVELQIEPCPFEHMTAKPHEIG